MYFTLGISFGKFENPRSPEWLKNRISNSTFFGTMSPFPSVSSSSLRMAVYWEPRASCIYVQPRSLLSLRLSWFLSLLFLEFPLAHTFFCLGIFDFFCFVIFFFLKNPKKLDVSIWKYNIWLDRRNIRIHLATNGKQFHRHALFRSTRAAEDDYSQHVGQHAGDMLYATTS